MPYQQQGEPTRSLVQVADAVVSAAWMANGVIDVCDEVHITG